MRPNGRSCRCTCCSSSWSLFARGGLLARRAHSMSDPAHAPNDSERLDGKVAFIAGGYGVIGAAIARGLARRGATVVIAGRDLERATALAKALAAEGTKSTAIAVDARSVESIRAAVDTAASRHGGLDIFVHSLGAP